MADYPGHWMEKNLIPDMFSANVVTLLGQIPALVIAGYMITQFGTNLDGSVYPESWVFYAMAFATQWFSQFDIMDGNRARRLKAGSPVGRLVDEAFDMIM